MGMRLFDLVIAVSALAVGILIGSGVTMLAAPAPVSPLPVSCPTEDSCTVDYRGGAWHIEPVGDGR